MWQPVEGFEGLYEIDEQHNVRNARSKRPLPVKSKRVTLCAQGVVSIPRVADLRPSDKPVPPPPRPKVRKESWQREMPPKTSAVSAAQVHHGIWSPDRPATLKLIGDAGEHLVAYELTKRGVRSATGVLEGAPYDIVADFGHGLFFTVQVKTTAAPKAYGRTITPAYEFTCLPADRTAIDIFAFVALDKSKVLFKLACEHPRSTLRLSPLSFGAESDASIDAVLLDLYNRMK